MAELLNIRGKVETKSQSWLALSRMFLSKSPKQSAAAIYCRFARHQANSCAFLVYPSTFFFRGNRPTYCRFHEFAACTLGSRRIMETDL